jgi:hypothetical protein
LSHGFQPTISFLNSLLLFPVLIHSFIQ